MNKILVAGIGPGNPAYILPAARAAIDSARILVGGKRALADFARPGQEVCPVTGDIPGVMDFIRQKLAVADVCVMVSGDPGYYSLLDALRREFPLEQLEVIPGISALQMAFARLVLPWHGARLLSFHGREPAAEDLAYRPGAVLGLLTDGIHTSHSIAACLMGYGWPAQAVLHICQRLSYADEAIYHLTLGEAQSYPELAHGVLVVEG